MAASGLPVQLRLRWVRWAPVPLPSWVPFGFGWTKTKLLAVTWGTRAVHVAAACCVGFVPMPGSLSHVSPLSCQPLAPPPHLASYRSSCAMPRHRTSHRIQVVSAIYVWCRAVSAVVPSMFGAAPAREARMSAMQRHLQARTTNQAEIIGTVANESALAVISRASGEQGKFAIFHHISTESHASKGGAVSVPTVFSCHGLYEAKVAVWTHQSRWEVLSKSTLPAEIPTLPTILAREGSSKAEDKEGPLERVSSAAFIVVNGRALEELEKHIDSSYDSLLKALVDLASRDLIADFEESNPGETPPSIPELARIKIKNREEVPFGQQIMPAPRISHGLPLATDICTQREPKPAGFSVTGGAHNSPPPLQQDRIEQQRDVEAMEPGESGMEDPAEANEVTGDRETDARGTDQQAQE
ncbi:hypothetical protein THAOC_18086, partial [Thalassiosira oceanica]